MKITKTICVHADTANPLSQNTYFLFGQDYLNHTPDFFKVAEAEVTFDIDLSSVVAKQVSSITAQIDAETKAFHLKVAELEALRNNLLCLEA